MLYCTVLYQDWLTKEHNHKHFSGTPVGCCLNKHHAVSGAILLSPTVALCSSLWYTIHKLSVLMRTYYSVARLCRATTFLFVSSQLCVRKGHLLSPRSVPREHQIPCLDVGTDDDLAHGNSTFCTLRYFACLNYSSKCFLFVSCMQHALSFSWVLLEITELRLSSILALTTDILIIPALR